MPSAKEFPTAVARKAAAHFLWLLAAASILSRAPVGRLLAETGDELPSASG